MVTEEEAMKICHTTLEDLDKRAKKYEKSNYERNNNKVFIGSHIDRVGKKRVTVIYDADDTQQVHSIAKNRGVKPSSIYREALKFYLSHVNM